MDVDLNNGYDAWSIDNTPRHSAINRVAMRNSHSADRCD